MRNHLCQKTPAPIRAAGLVAILLGSFFVASCGDIGNAPADSGTNGETFVAFASDFEGFQNWPSFQIPDSEAQGNVHLAGPKTDYVNHMPAHGSTSFPVGTIIVKEVNVGAFAQRQVFAMVKRGGNYGLASAPNWEWFELSLANDGSFSSILWRGFGPPTGGGYGGTGETVCAGCHSLSSGNDYVQSMPLQLTSF